MRGPLTGWCALGLFVAVLGVAHAAPTALAEARRLAAEAAASFRDESYADAAQAYAAACRLVPSAQVKLNEALSWSRAGQAAPAADAYELALKLGTLDAKQTAVAHKALNALADELGVLVVVQPRGGTVSVAHAQQRPVPARIHLPPGKHEVEVVEPRGERHLRRVQIAAGADTHLVLPVHPSHPSGTASQRPRGARPAGVTAEPDSAARDEGAGWRVAGWLLVGVGAASAVAAVPLGVSFLGARAEFIDGGRRDAGLRGTAVTLQTLTTTSIVVAAAGAGLGTTLLLVAPGRSGEPDSGMVGLALGLKPPGIELRFAW